MNLNAYDSIPEKLDKTKTWIIPSSKVLLSREITPRNYVCISKRLNINSYTYDYYIILLDEAPTDRTYTRLKIDDYGRVKIRLNSIWNITNLKNIKKDSNISIEHIEHSDDGDIYYLDI